MVQLQLHVVFQCAVRFECEKSRVHVADHLAAFVRQADQAQTLPVGVGVFAQGGDDAREIALADGLQQGLPRWWNMPRLLRIPLSVCCPLPPVRSVPLRR